MSSESVVDRLESWIDPLAPDEAEERDALDAFLTSTLPDGRGEILEHRAEFPEAELRAFAACGLVDALVPEAQGGRLDWARAMRLASRLAAHDLDVTLCLGGTVLGATPLLVAGTQEQLAQYFEPVRRGEMGGLALTEWKHGSDLLAGEARATPRDEHGRAVTLAEATHFMLSGEKSPTNNGTRGANVVVLARTSEDADAFTHTLFLVPRDAVGVLPGRKFSPMGFRNMDLSGVGLSGVTLPASAVVGKVGEGFAHTRQALSISRSGVAHMATGAAAAALGRAAKHVYARKLYGAPIAELGGVADLLATVTGRTIAAHALARVASRAVARFGPEARAWTSAAKLVCPDALEANVHDVGTLLGGRSLFVDDPFSRLRRSAPVLAIFDGSSQLQLDELWRYAGSWPDASPSEAAVRDAARALFDATRVPFDVRAPSDGDALRLVAPTSVLSATSRWLRPLGRAAAHVRERAGASRRATQREKFAVSRAAAELFTLSAISVCRAATDDDVARDVLGAALDEAAAKAGPRLASALLEIDGARVDASVLDLARDLVGLAALGPDARARLGKVVAALA